MLLAFRCMSPGTAELEKEPTTFSRPIKPATFSVWPTQDLAAPIINGLVDE